jgi:hypothetical protein
VHHRELAARLGYRAVPSRDTVAGHAVPKRSSGRLALTVTPFHGVSFLLRAFDFAGAHMVKRKATKKAPNSKSLKKAAPTTTKKVAVTKPLARKSQVLVKAMTDDGVTL